MPATPSELTVAAPGAAEPTAAGVPATERRLAMLVELSSDGIVGVAHDGVITDWSRGAETILGRPAAEAVGKLWLDFVPPEERAHEDEVLTQAFDGVASPVHESRRVRADGTFADVIVATFPYRGERGDVAGATQVIRDVSSLRSLEEQLRRAQRLSAQGMLAAMTAHDVTNSLGVALGHATLCRELHADDAALRAQFDPIIHAIKLAGSICNQFRNLATDASAAGCDEIDLVETARAGFQMLERVVERELVFEAPAQRLPVIADPTLIEQILVNLVLNARDATGPQGRIAVRVRSQPSDDAAAPVILEVEDNGVGIPPEIQRNLFKAFFTTKRRGRGTGLGLASVLKLVKEMGGELELDSVPGRGTAMRIVLPRAGDALSHSNQP